MINKQLLDKARLISLFIALLGGAFKLMHWPGANVCLITGLGTLTIVHIIMGFDASIKSPQAKYINYARNFSIAVLLMGVLFYLMHWQGDKRMIYTGAAGLALSFVLPMLLPGSGEDDQ